MAEWKSVSFEDGVDTKIATHAGNASAHHTKYTDAEAVTAVETGDDYVKNTGDTITGALSQTGYLNRILQSNGYFGWYGYDGAKKLTWFGGETFDEGGGNYSGLYGYWVSYNGGTEVLKLRIGWSKVEVLTYLFMTTIRSGSTQANAGASANEVWKTSGHATLPDNVLMIGI